MAEAPGPTDDHKGVSEPAVRAADDGRIAALESQFLAVTGLLADLAEAQRAESIRRQEASDAMQSDVSAALARSVDEAHVTDSLTDAVELVRSELVALATGLAETRSELRMVAESYVALAAAQTDLDRRLLEAESRVGSSLAALRDELYDALTEGFASVEQRRRGGEEVAPPPPAPVGPNLLADLDRQLQEAETRLAGRLSTRDRI